MDHLRISTFQIYKYSLPLSRPFFIKGKELKKRQGIILALKTEEGFEGFGEVAPLPGMSEETLEEALAQVQTLKSTLTGEDIPNEIELLDGKFEEWLGEFSLGPAVRFGIEMAVLNLIAHTRNLPLCRIIGEPYHDYITVSGLLQGNEKEVLKQAEELIQQGFSGLKLKVGSKDLDEDIHKVHALTQKYGEKALLHVDANQAWNLEMAKKFGESVGCASIDYIEEPFKNIEDIPEFYADTTIPVALDESLMALSIDEVKSIEGVDLLILKPAILGGIEKIWEITSRARTVGLTSVVSSTFESGIGILALANIAACLSRFKDAGLDTLKWFDHDLLNEKILYRKGRIDVSQRLIQTQNINFKMLKEIDAD
jgi:o-succinylbenzoate synthase